jgi:hypothetical protein
VTPHLSTGPSGDVFATWISGSGISVARRSVTNGAWSTPTTLDSVGSLSGGAQIVVNALGDALAVWDSGTLGPHIVRTARFDHLAGRWSAPLDISGPDTTSMIVTNASIAGDSTGNAVAAWLRADGRIQAARFSAASMTWSTPIDLAAAGSEGRSPRVTMDSSGTATVVWAQLPSLNNQLIGTVYAARSTASAGTWSAAEPISDPTALSFFGPDPQVAAAANGDVTTTWLQAGVGIQSSRYTASLGTWDQAVTISSNQYAHGSSVAVNASGDAVASWSQWAGASVVAAALRDSSGSTWGPPTLLTRSAETGVQPTAIIDDAGRAAVIWIGSDGYRSMADLARFDPDAGTWSDPERLSVSVPSGLGSGQYPEPQLTVDPVGNLTAIWRRFDGAYDRLESARSVIAGFTAVGPQRVFDTRPDESPNSLRTVTKTKVGPDNPLQVHITDLSDLVPANGVSAVSLNVTTTNGNAPGFITVYPCNNRTLVSNLNFTTDQTIANAVIVPVSPTGHICFYSNTPTDIVADINGWFSR